jgi:excisionase family DNA binding protein
VELSPHGARLVHLALVALVRQAAARDGGKPADDLSYLATVVRLAVARADGAAPVTGGLSFRLDLPPPGQMITVAEAAAIRGVTPQAIRKAIRAGRFPAQRHGSLWLVPEEAVRRA